MLKRVIPDMVHSVWGNHKLAPLWRQLDCSRIMTWTVGWKQGFKAKLDYVKKMTAWLAPNRLFQYICWLVRNHIWKISDKFDVCPYLHGVHNQISYRSDENELFISREWLSWKINCEFNKYRYMNEVYYQGRAPSIAMYGKTSFKTWNTLLPIQATL